MFLPTPQKPVEPETIDPMLAAVAAVAEQSFFAYVEPFDGTNAESASRSWLMAAVRFSDGEFTGSVACWLPSDLAQTLFDAFAGRDPAEPRAHVAHIDDLIGEFANMVCGDWLTRCVGHRTLQLSPPLVLRVASLASNGTRRLWVKVNDRPVAIDWDIIVLPQERGGAGAL